MRAGCEGEEVSQYKGLSTKNETEDLFDTD